MNQADECDNDWRFGAIAVRSSHRVKLGQQEGRHPRVIAS